jgi:hypothetical protein
MVERALEVPCWSLARFCLARFCLARHSGL